MNTLMLASVVACLVCAVAVSAQPFGFTYSAGNVKLSFDPTVNPSYNSPITAAAGVISQLLPIFNNVTVSVTQANLGTSFGAVSIDFFDASGSPGAHGFASGFAPNTLVVAQALFVQAFNQRSDFTAANPAASPFDIRITINSALSYYTMLDGNAMNTQYDLFSLALHLLVRGMGFQATPGTVVGNTITLTTPSSYDNLILTSTGVSWTSPSLTPSNRYTLATLGLFIQFGSTVAVLHTPNPYVSGDSISNLDETVYGLGNPNSLMTPAFALGEAVHYPGPLALQILGAVGWQAIRNCSAYTDCATCVLNACSFCTSTLTCVDPNSPGTNGGVGPVTLTIAQCAATITNTSGVCPTPTPTFTPTFTPTPSFTFTPTLTFSPTASGTFSPTLSPSSTPNFQDCLAHGNGVFLSRSGTFFGTQCSDKLFGLGTDDTINGRDGDDVIAGLGGNNLLTGSNGYDTFVVCDNTASQYDAILDFSLNFDIVDTTCLGAGQTLTAVDCSIPVTQLGKATTNVSGACVTPLSGGRTIIFAGLTGAQVNANANVFIAPYPSTLASYVLFNFSGLTTCPVVH